jgi:Ca2+-binding RTX toxin-like protein
VPDFAAVVETSALNGANGFQISGEATYSYAGGSVSNVGDINGDGIADFVVGGRGFSGGVYVVFGRTGGFPADLNLSTLNGSNGFQITASGSMDQVSEAGDINGDGLADLIIGRPFDNNPDGAAYVLFGRSTGFSASFDLSTLTGSVGFKLTGDSNGDYSASTGQSVSSAGDVNGDGFDDLIVGAPGFNSSFGGGPSSEGAAYVVFGKAGGFGAGLTLSSLNGTNGFRMTGQFGYAAGASVSGAGDINNDGYDDVVISAQGNQAYVVYGKAGGFAANLSLSALNGTNGTRIVSGESGGGNISSVSSAGDVNGDGIDDLLLGSNNSSVTGLNAGSSYVVFGRNGGLGASLNLANLNGADGFRIRGEAAGDSAGGSVAAAGDVNGDGYDDIIIGAGGGDANGANSGQAYVVLGHGGPFAANLLLSGLSGTDGFQINGEAAGDGFGVVGGGGDFNDDGIADIIIGARNADPGGLNSAGAAYVVFGIDVAITFIGTNADDNQSGTAGGDSLSGGGGRDTLRGLAGADTLDGGDLSDLLYGGDGADDLIGGAGGDILYGDAGADEANGGLGNDKLFGGDDNDVLNGGDGNDRLVGDAGDDTLTGGLGNDQLDGGSGSNSLTGGLGNDIYYVRNAGDVVVEAADEGIDIVKATRCYTLGDNLEQLELLGGNWSGTGNALGNRITGSAGANFLSGEAGNDLLFGGDGADTLLGGAGRDQLTGGAGADTFVVRDESVALPALEIDQILDFSIAQGDRLNLMAVDADITAGADGDQAFEVVAALTGEAGQLFMFYTASQDVTTLRLDVDGDGRADYQLRINGDVTGDTGWLLL